MPVCWALVGANFSMGYPSGNIKAREEGLPVKTVAARSGRPTAADRSPHVTPSSRFKKEEPAG